MKLLLEITLMQVVLLGSSSIALSQNAQPIPCPERNYKREPNLTTWFEPQRDETRVILKLPRPPCTDDYEMQIGFWHAGRELKAPKTVSFLFMQVLCTDSKACYLTAVLDNGERLPLGELIGTGMHVTSSGADMYVNAPAKTFLRIARAKKVQVIIGMKKFELSEKYIEAMRQLADRIEDAG